MTLESDVKLTSNGRQMSAGSNIEKKKKERKKAKETHKTNDLIFTQSEVSLICTPHMVSMKNTRSKSRLDYDV